jgi:phosphatidylinositol alpha-1,6-mannosyltransferase
VRKQFGIAPESTVVVSVSRLVPRKGMDVLIRAAARLAPVHPELEVIIGGSGRDRARLERLVAELAAPVRLVGRVDDDDLPGLYGAADIFTMDCRNRWLGLEQEGFGIVFLEAAACGIPQVAGQSGGAAEAVLHGETGLVVQDPRSVAALADALRALIIDPDRRAAMGAAGRIRAEDAFSYDVLAAQLRGALNAWTPR